MSRYHLSAGAEADLAELLHWSEDRFGAAARDRYAALAFAALRNVADDPHQPNILWRRIGSTEIGVYHMVHSRDRVAPEGGRVAEPRHYVVFTVGADGIAEILGFVHDSMLLHRAFRRLLER